MTELDGDKPEEYHPSGGMRSAMGVMSQDGLSGPGKSGFIDLRPDTGISGLAWLGIAAAVVVVAILLWSWLFPH